MRVGGFIVARMGSVRLPGKAMAPLAGRPLVGRLAERLEAAAAIDRVVIATSTEASDDPLAAYAAEAGIACHRGSLDDVMARICGAARATGCDVVVEILGDNPLVHGALIDDVVALFHGDALDYAANLSRDYRTRPPGAHLFPIGVRVQAYSIEVAERHVEFPDMARDPARHPSSFIFDRPDLFRVGYVEARGRWDFMAGMADVNLAVNHAANLEMVRRVFDRQYPADPDFPLERVVEQIREEPDLLDLLGPPGGEGV